MDSPFLQRVPKGLVDNLRWRQRVLLRATKDLEFRRALLQACSSDFLFWTNGFVWTYDPRLHSGAKVPMITYPYQDRALEKLHDAVGHHDVLIEKSRDMGASWMNLILFLWFWRFRSYQSLLLVSRSERYVDEIGNPKCLFWKLDFAHRHMPRWLMPEGWSASACRKKLHLENPENGSVIDGESTTGDVARGDRRTAIMIDEYAAFKPSEDYNALRATRDATETRVFNSTPKGVANAYFDLTQTNISKIRLHWSEHPVKARGLYTFISGEYRPIDTDYWLGRDDWRQEMKELDRFISDKGVDLSEGKLRSPWYARQVDRCVHAAEAAQELDIDYIGSGHAFFNATLIRYRIKQDALRPHLVGELEHYTDNCQPIKFEESEYGCLRLWLNLDQRGDPPQDRQYIIGADVAAGTGASNSALCILDAKTSTKVGEYASPIIRPEAFGRLAVALCHWLGNAYLVWEAPGPGRQFGASVIDTGYRDIYYRKSTEAISGTRSLIPGWSPTPDAKRALLGNYRDALERGLFTNHSEEALRECLQYTFQPSGSVEHSRAAHALDPSGAKSNHGDRVIADALAWMGLHDRRVVNKDRPREIPYGSAAWRRQQWKQEDAKMDNPWA